MIINGVVYTDLNLQLIKFDYCEDSQSGSSTFAVVSPEGTQVGLVTTTSTGLKGAVESECYSKALRAIKK